MDGSLLAYLAEHPAASTIGVIVALTIGAALYRHTATCRDSRREMRDAVKENTQAVHAVGERVAAVEALLNLRT